jgi:hypothetical protein
MFLRERSYANYGVRSDPTVVSLTEDIGQNTIFRLSCYILAGTEFWPTSRYIRETDTQMALAMRRRGAGGVWCTTRNATVLPT